MASPRRISLLCWFGTVLLLPWQPASVLAPLPTSPNCTQLTLEAEPKLAHVGGTVHLTCSLRSQATRPTEPDTSAHNARGIQWFHNGSSLSPGVRVQTLDQVGASQVILADLRLAQGGRYSCCLNASCPEEDCLASQDILVGWPPEEATALSCTSNNFKNANCTWTRGGQHSNLITRDVLKRKARQNEWQLCNDEANATCTATTCHLYCLEAMMSHSYRVESSNELATVFSDEITFDLDTGTRLDPPVDVTVTNRSSSSLRVQWSIPPSLSRHYTEEGALRLIGFCLRYKWEGSPNVTKLKIPVTEHIINNLTHPYGLYQVRVGTFVRYTSKDKCWGFSKKVYGRTTEVAPVNSSGEFTCPVTLDRGNVQNVDLAWKAVPNEYKQNGEILGYRIMVYNQNMKNPITVAVNPNVSSHRMQVPLSNRDYTISLQTRNSMGLSQPKWCLVSSVSPGASLVPVLVSAIVLCGVLVVLCMVWARKKYKASIRSWPAIRLPQQLTVVQNDNDAHPRSPSLVREREVFDQLPIKQQVRGDIRQNGGVFGVGSHTGAWGGRSQPVTLELRSLSQANAACDTDGSGALSPGYQLLPGDRLRHPSSGASSPHSPLSVASGGSYMILKDPGQAVHSPQRECLSPTDWERQRIGCDWSPGLGVKRDPNGLTSCFVWDDGIIDEQALGLGIFTETGDQQLGSPPLNSPLNSPRCHSIVQGKNPTSNECHTGVSVTEESGSSAWGLVPVAEETDEKEAAAHGQREHLSLVFDWADPSVLWGSLPNAPKSGASGPTPVPPMDSKREMSSAGFCGMEQRGPGEVAVGEEFLVAGADASNYREVESQRAKRLSSEQEALLSPDSTDSWPISYERLNYVSVCSDGSGKDVEELETSSQLSAGRPRCVSDASAPARDKTSGAHAADDGNQPTLTAVGSGMREHRSVGYCGMNEAGSRRAASEGESAPASDYCQMNPNVSDELTGASQGNTGSDWSQLPGDAGDGKFFPSEQVPLPSPASSISSPGCEARCLQGSSLLVKDYDSLNYISVCADGSDDEDLLPDSNSDSSVTQKGPRPGH